MARVDYSNFNYKQACAKFNMVRIHYIGKEIGTDQIVQAIKTAGLGWHTMFMPYLIQYGCVLKKGRGRGSKFAFTSEPLLYTKLYDAHKAYLRARREKPKKVESVVQNESFQRTSYWTSTNSWDL